MGDTEVGSELGSVETEASVAVQATIFKKVKLVTSSNYINQKDKQLLSVA